jgi:hypothetical protein
MPTPEPKLKIDIIKASFPNGFEFEIPATTARKINNIKKIMLEQKAKTGILPISTDHYLTNSIRSIMSSDNCSFEAACCKISLKQYTLKTSNKTVSLFKCEYIDHYYQVVL